MGFVSELIHSADGTPIHFRRWKPTQTKQGSLLIVHGAGEHSGRYVHVGRFFAEAQWEVLAFDFRGHGKSGGKRGYFKRYEDLALDLQAASNVLGEPQIVLGHSFGGQVVLWSIAKRFIAPAGVIASAPWLALERHPPFVITTLAKILNRIAPQTSLPTGIDHQKISSDVEHLESLEDLNLVLHFIRVHSFFESEKAAAYLRNLVTLECPLLLSHGTADPVISLEINRQFFDRIHAPSKEIKIYEGMRHELHNEIIRSIVLKDYLTWAQNVLARNWPKQ